jgi:hypothetical protein
VEKINQVTKLKLIEMMKVNNPKAKEKKYDSCLPSSVLMNLRLGERAAFRSTTIK